LPDVFSYQQQFNIDQTISSKPLRRNSYMPASFFSTEEIFLTIFMPKIPVKRFVLF